MAVADEGRYVRLHCGGCGHDVYHPPSDITLVIGDNQAAYEFACQTCGPRTQDAHPFLADQLRRAGAVIVHPAERAHDADRLRDDLQDDDAVADEIEGWSTQ